MSGSDPLDQAKNLIEAGKDELAIPILEEAIRQNPTDARAWAMLAIVHEEPRLKRHHLKQVIAHSTDPKMTEWAKGELAELTPAQSPDQLAGEAAARLTPIDPPTGVGIAQRPFAPKPRKAAPVTPIPSASPLSTPRPTPEPASRGRKLGTFTFGGLLVSIILLVAIVLAGILYLPGLFGIESPLVAQVEPSAIPPSETLNPTSAPTEVPAAAPAETQSPTLPPTTSPQPEAAQPIYSVAYPLLGGIGVTTFYSDQSSHTEIIEGGLYDNLVQNYVKPVWSPDGRFLYLFKLSPSAPVDANGTPAIYATWLHVYDVQERTLTPLVDFAPPEAGLPTGAPIIVDLSLSPDGRTIWASIVHGPSASYVFDLQANKLTKVLDCPASIMGWLPHKVVVTETLQCAFNMRIVDLATNSVEATWQASQSPEGTFPVFVTLDQERVWVWMSGLSGDKKQFFAGDIRSGEIVPIAAAVDSWVSQNHSLAAVKNDLGHLLRFSGNPQRFEDVGALGEVYSSYTYDDAIRFWERNDLGGGQFSVTTSTLTAGSRTDENVYEGVVADWNKVFVSPYGAHLVLFTEAADGHWGAELYGPQGFSWKSRDALPDNTFSYNEAYWSQDGNWVYFTAGLAETGDRFRALAVNVNTGQVIESPLADDYRFMGASPDGQWWVVMQTVDEETRIAAAFNTQSGSTNDLMADIPVQDRLAYTRGGLDVLIPPVFIWSPVLTNP